MKKKVAMMSHDTSPMTSPEALGTESIRWDLTAFYAGPEDAAIAADVARLLAIMEAFHATYRGQLGTRLGESLTASLDIVKLSTKLSAYFGLAMARDTQDPVLRREASRMQETITASHAAHMTFYDLETAHLPEQAYQAQLADPVVKHHAPMIEHLRKLGHHFLPEKVEQSLTERSPFGPSEWSDMMSELETTLRFDFDGKALTLPELLHVLSEDRDAGRRASALKVLNDGLESQRLAYFAARTLNVMAGSYRADITARGYSHLMEAVNLGNKVDDATVAALHEVVSTKGAEFARRYYKLKARLLGLETLRWSDRNASMPFAPTDVIGWEEACTMVRAAYHQFSPTLGGLVDTVLDPANGWVDAPPSPTKTSGAFDYTVVLPEGSKSYMLLNHLGSPNDVMTLAHELGHAVHGLLGAEAQGPLMWHAPMPYAETASIFGEMLTFESLVRTTTDRRSLLALYMDKMGDFINTVIRQINFSEFEQAFHRQRTEGKLSAEDLDKLWHETTVRFYGAEGEVFTYADTSHLWAYISHFHAYSPFYVYAYAFGELFTQSLMATRGTVGAEFEPNYLELLRAGGTKDAVGLMAPFGLNPNERNFWEAGIEASIGKWIVEAEKLVEELGL